MPKNPNIQNMRKFMQRRFRFSRFIRALNLCLCINLGGICGLFPPVFAQIPVNNPFFAQ